MQHCILEAAETVGSKRGFGQPMLNFPFLGIFPCGHDFIFPLKSNDFPCSAKAFSVHDLSGQPTGNSYQKPTNDSILPFPIFCQLAIPKSDTRYHPHRERGAVTCPATRPPRPCRLQRVLRPLPGASRPLSFLHLLRALLRALRQPGLLVAGKHAPRQRRLPSPGLQPLPAMASTTKFLPSRR